MNNFHELVMHNHVSPKQYLQQVLDLYPYDIEESLVFSLLEEPQEVHPSLLKFINFTRNIQKYHILDEAIESESLDSLFETICKISQRNKMVLHTHQFQFDATLYTRPYHFHNPYAYLAFHEVLLIDRIHIQLPLSISMKASAKETIITKTESFLYKDISFQPDHFYALSIQIADRYGIVYIPRNHIGLLCACATLYQISAPIQNPDFLLLYGLNDTIESYEYYFDNTNQLYLGLVKGNETYNHFDILNTMIRTLDNEICRKKHDYPIRGAMLNLTFSNRNIGVLFCGKQRCGKSAMMDAICQQCLKQSIEYKKIFDDQGTLHYLDDDIYATGTQIGAYQHVNALPKNSLFKNISASVILKENTTATHLLMPFTNHEETCRFHKVDYVIYLDSSNDSQGYEILDDLNQAKKLMQTNSASTQDSLLDEYLEYIYLKNIPFLHVSMRTRGIKNERFYERHAKQLLQYLNNT